LAVLVLSDIIIIFFFFLSAAMVAMAMAKSLGS
jgi:hypothetical protein